MLTRDFLACSLTSMGGSLGQDAGELRLESPPVQQVVLSIFLKPLLALRTSQLIPIIGKWEKSYPQLDELPHQQSWRPLTSDEVGELGSLGRPSPTPLFIMRSADQQRSLQIQRDRFELVWRFEATGSQNEYVGYRSLREEIEQRFSEFSDAVRETAKLEVIPERADATYQNLIDMPVRDFCVGVLSSWESSNASLSVASAYSGMRLGGLEGEPEGGYSVIRIDPGPDGQGTDLTIDVQCPVSPDRSYLVSLDEAHRLVVSLFTGLVGAELLESWGPKR